MTLLGKPTCPICAGEGVVDAGFEWEDCSACYSETCKVCGPYRDCTCHESEVDIPELSESVAALPFELHAEKIAALETILASKNTLVKARAGSGKTTLLLAVVSKLVHEYAVDRNNIFMISFNKSVKEKNAEALKKWGVDQYYGTQTFHSLAFQIAKPDRTKILEDQNNDKRLLDFLIAIVKKENSLWFRLKYWWYLKELDKEVKPNDAYISLRGEKVKSHGEKTIADFLFENGVSYTYEPVYRWGEGQYRPDFEIVADGKKFILEYWGRSDEKYVQQMKQKRNYCAENGISLIEMSYKDFAGNDQSEAFLRVLESKIVEAEIPMRKLTVEEIAEQAFELRFKAATKSILSFIQLARVRRVSPDDLQNRIAENRGKMRKKDLFFAELSHHVYEKYLNRLEEDGLYDFARMIEKATAEIKKTNGECALSLGLDKSITISVKNIEWMLIDEYQDCSPMFNAFLQSIRAVNPRVRFVCVGDDWQAINGFAGSDTQYISHFENFFEDAAYATLLTNFRSPQNIVDAGNDLMRGLGEPARSQVPGGETFVGDVQKSDEAITDRYHEMPSLYLEIVLDVIRHFPKGTTFAILHRTNAFFSESLVKLQYEIRKKAPGFPFEVSTIHMYKGKEADVVIILNATEKNHPFLHPDRSRNAILGQTDEKIILEERRLFYVAVTRAKQKTYILTETGVHSPFISDLHRE